MPRLVLVLVLMFAAAFASAQDTIVSPVRDTVVKRTDTTKKPYVNPGKVAGRKAAFRSMILPGLGQIGNGITVYRALKVAGIYTGGTMLALSYIENNNNYHEVLEELQYRELNNNKATPDGRYRLYDTDGLIPAKDTFRRNREVIVFSFVGLYLLNIVEAYIDARLKHFNVDDIAFKVKPGIITTPSMYGFNQQTPALTLAFTF